MILRVWGLAGVLIITSAGTQVAASQEPANGHTSVPVHKRERGPGGEIGSGAAAIGKGTAKGAGHLVMGAGKGAADLVTLHPVDAAASVGKGAGTAGKDVGTGAVKGGVRITKGAGKGLKKIL